MILHNYIENNWESDEPEMYHVEGIRRVIRDFVEHCFDSVIYIDENNS